MKLYDLQAIRKQKENAAPVITLEDVKQFNKTDLMEHLQVCIDALTEEELHSKDWNWWRDYIDSVVEIIEVRLN